MPYKSKRYESIVFRDGKELTTSLRTTRVINERWMCEEDYDYEDEDEDKDIENHSLKPENYRKLVRRRFNYPWSESLLYEAEGERYERSKKRCEVKLALKFHLASIAANKLINNIPRDRYDRYSEFLIDDLAGLV